MPNVVRKRRFKSAGKNEKIGATHGPTFGQKGGRVGRAYNAVRLTPVGARQLLEACGIAVGADYNELTQSQTTPLLAEADRLGCRKPRLSNSSLTLHFYNYVDRTARRREPMRLRCPTGKGRQMSVGQSVKIPWWGSALYC